MVSRSLWRRLSLALILAVIVASFAAVGVGAAPAITVAPNPVVVHVGIAPTVPPGTFAAVTVTVAAPGGTVLFHIGAGGSTCAIPTAVTVCNVPMPTYLQSGKTYLLQATYIGPGGFSHTQTYAKITP